MSSGCSISKNKKYKTTKLSIGLACVRKNPQTQNYEVLLVRKRYTYAFYEFLFSRYLEKNYKADKQAKYSLIGLFNKMTVEEKSAINSLDFDNIWYRIRPNNERNEYYHRLKSQFESAFLANKNNSIMLRNMIAKSNNIGEIWEIPKGHKKGRLETDINCAIREFEEETNITKKAYRLIPDFKKVYTITDNGVDYNVIYFAAIVCEDINLKISFNNKEQLNEICDIKWMDLSKIKFVDPSEKLAEFVKVIFEYVKKELKK